ncbi:hypothetical protein EDB94_3788 [Marinobacter sp. 3-2]|jgi:hypothetical protein|nr:hypothetical protein EDB94_3788 [Marinobacter sp. 3-2]
MLKNKDTYLQECREFCETRKFVAERWECSGIVNLAT